MVNNNISSEEVDPKFRLMADSSPVLLWMAAIDARCIFFNKPWLEFTGRTMEQEIGFGWAEGIYFEDFRPTMDTFTLFFNKREAFSMEYRLRRQDGVFRWILDNGRPYFDTNNNFLGYLGSCVDISDLKASAELELKNARLEVEVSEREKSANALMKANQEITKAVDELAKTNEDLEAFAFAMSHNLQAPLITCINYVRFASKSDVKETEKKKWFAKIQSKLEDLEKIIESILKLSQVQKEQIINEEFDIAGLISSVKDDLKEEFRNCITCYFNDVQLVKSDKVLLRQVMLNILHNAVHYRHQSRSLVVTVTITSNQHHYEFCIADNGMGISKERLANIFRPFRRLKSSRHKGSGLGLFAVDKIIRRLGGHCWIKSDEELGNGTEVFFTLPK